MSDLTTIEETNSKSKDYLINNKTYDFLKKLVQIILPAFGTFYLTFGNVWDLPGTKQVSDTIIALCTFIGVLLSISARSYNKSDLKYDGSIEITNREDGSKLYSLNLNDAAEKIDEKKNVNFKVQNT